MLKKREILLIFCIVTGINNTVCRWTNFCKIGFLQHTIKNMPCNLEILSKKNLQKFLVLVQKKKTETSASCKTVSSSPISLQPQNYFKIRKQFYKIRKRPVKQFHHRQFHLNLKLICFNTIHSFFKLQIQFLSSNLN